MWIIRRTLLLCDWRIGVVLSWVKLLILTSAWLCFWQFQDFQVQLVVSLPTSSYGQNCFCKIQQYGNLKTVIVWKQLFILNLSYFWDDGFQLNCENKYFEAMMCPN